MVAAALLIALGGQLAGRGAEGAGGAGGDNHGWDDEEGAGATGLEAAEAIGSEEGRGVGARGDAQQRGG